MSHISHYANRLIKIKYQNINILDVYEDNGHEFDLWDLYIYYKTSDGSKMVDNWHWKEWEEWYIGNRYGYITEDNCKTYSCKDFLEHDYFRDRIVPHLYIKL